MAGLVFDARRRNATLVPCNDRIDYIGPDFLGHELD